MNRRSFLKAAALSVVAFGARAAQAKAPKPNFVIVFPDQMRAQAMGFMGIEPMVMTPRLDAFAKESHVFTQAVSNYPVCSPFRAMLMTGAWPHANTVITNCRANPSNPAFTPCELPKAMTCWSDVLHAGGYSTGYIGKWHLDAPHKPFIPTSNNNGPVKWNEWCPPDRRHGFDYWYAYGTYDNHLRPMYWDTRAPRDGFNYVDQWGPEHEADKAIAYISNACGTLRDPEKPFALVVSMNPPHTGYELVPQRYLNLYKDKPLADFLHSPAIPPEETPMGKNYRRHIKQYYAAVTGVDEQFGRILDALKAKGIADSTAVFFFSDHGDCLGMHGMITKNNPYEESMRIPMLIRWPGKIKPALDPALINAVDLCPTILGLAGFAAHMPAQVKGRDLAAYLLSGSGPGPRDAQPYQFFSGGGVVENAMPGGVPLAEAPMSKPIPRSGFYGRRGVRNARYTAIFSKVTPEAPFEAHLFDRETDPHQLRNAAAEHPEVVVACRKKLKTLLEEMQDPFAALL